MLDSDLDEMLRLDMSVVCTENDSHVFYVWKSWEEDLSILFLCTDYEEEGLD